MLVGAACGGGGDAADTLPTTTSVAVATTSSTIVGDATTTTVSTTSTTTASTTSTTSTTVPTAAELILRNDSLGTALFGTDPDGVVRYVSSIIGDPTADTGWVDPISLGAPCPGSEVRFVTWGDLVLFFTDDSPVSRGTRHFASYAYGPPFAAEIEPLGLLTSAGISVGSTVRDLLVAHPEAIVNPEDELTGPSFQIAEGLFGFLTGIGDGDTIISFVGGFGCGE
jgi:hypothetical protein